MIRKIMLTIIITFAIGVIVYASTSQPQPQPQPRTTPQPTSTSTSTSTATFSQPVSVDKIKELQNIILDDLSLNCETKGIKEPDAAIIYDTNGEMSIGRFMFQIKTVQLFVKHFEQRDITRLESIKIAIDPEQSKELARKILFEYENGVRNWHNCNVKLNLAKQIELVKRVSK